MSVDNLESMRDARMFTWIGDEPAEEFINLGKHPLAVRFLAINNVAVEVGIGWGVVHLVPPSVDIPGRYSISASKPSSTNQATASSQLIILWRSDVPMVSKVFVKSRARADAALKDVIKNSRWPGGSKLLWGLFAGKAGCMDIVAKRLLRGW